MTRLLAWLDALPLWPRLLLAVVLGEIAALGLPPAGLWPATALTYAALPLLLPPRLSARGAAVVGFGFALGWFTLGLYWISFALFADGTGAFAWMLPFSVFGLPIVLSLFWAAGFWAWRRIAGEARGLAALAGLAGAIMLAEWLRGHLFTGFPWNLPAIVLVDTGWARHAGVTGLYGLSLLLVLACLLIPLAARRLPGMAVGGRVIIGSVLLIAVVAIGILSLRPVLDIRLSGAGIAVRIVQPAIPMSDKLRDRHAGRERLLTLTAQPGNPQLVVWPETAFAFSGDASPQQVVRMRAAIPAGARLVSGATRWSGRDADEQVANSMIILGDGNWPPKHYDKAHLVPFGEYVPFADFLPIQAIAGELRAYTPGPGGQTLALAWADGELPPVSDGKNLLPLPASALSIIPMICYEAIFPNVVRRIPEGPTVIVNVTNDAWYGQSAGPYQHLAQARYRTIELGVPMLRAANNGVSAVIDKDGHILQSLPLDSVGVIDMSVPVNNGTVTGTIYTRTGDIPFLLLCVIFLISPITRNLRAKVVN